MTTRNLPVPARLMGFTEQFGEPSACSLVFHLKASPNSFHNLRLGDVLTALRFAQEQGLVDALPDGWWERLGHRDGCCLQAEQGETDDLSR